MEPGEAARICSDAARLLTQALEKAPGAMALARGLSVVVERMEPGAAACICGKLTQALEEEIDNFEGELITEVLAAVAQHLPPSLAAKMATEICSGGRATDVDVLENSYNSPEFLKTLLSNTSRSEVNLRATAAATTVGLAPQGFVSPLPAFATTCKPFPCRLSTQDLVDLLKMPTCFGKARQVVLKHLGNRYGRRFANHWQFVRYAQEHHLDLDFTTPPKRPKVR